MGFVAGVLGGSEMLATLFWSCL